MLTTVALAVSVGVSSVLLVGWWRWWNHRPSWGPPTPRSRRQEFASRWRERRIRIRYWRWWPKFLLQGLRGHRLTLRRGYSTFVLDEFDWHFNKMACDSLRYHLSPECVVDNEDRREIFEDLIRRLEEPCPEANRLERAGIDTFKLDGGVAPGYENFPKTQQLHRLGECPPEARAAFESLRARQDDWAVRQKQARHDFVDIIDHLWS